MENRRSVRWDVAAIVMFAASALLWLSLLTHDSADNLGDFSGFLGSVYQPLHASYPLNDRIGNACGYMGALASDILLQATGVGAYYIAAMTILSGIVMLRQQPWASPMGRSIGWTLILVAVCTLPTRLGLQLSIPVPIGEGGYLGALCNTWLDRHLASAGSLIFVLSVLVGGVLLSTEYALLRYFGFAATGGLLALKCSLAHFRLRDRIYPRALLCGRTRHRSPHMAPPERRLPTRRPSFTHHPWRVPLHPQTIRTRMKSQGQRFALDAGRRQV